MSLRLRVTLVAALVVSLGLGVAGVLLVLSLRAGLGSGIDDAAEIRAQEVVSAVARDDLAGAVTTSGGDSSAVQVLASDGRVLASSPGLPDRALVAVPVAPGVGRAPDVSIGNTDARVLTRTADGRIVVVISPLTDLQELTTDLVGRMLVGGPVLLAIICVAVWLLVGYTLGTVDRLRQQVAALSAGALDRRVDVPVARDEVRELALTMNNLLDRLHRAAQAQRRFVADAAHELRSPLAALRTRVEVSDRARSLEAWQRAAPDLLSDSDRLAGLVDDLLALARLDESPRPRHPVPVDLDEIVFTEVARMRAHARVTLDTSGVSAGLVFGDPELLVRVVANLLANAVRHAASRVRIGVSTSGDSVEFTVADDGPGIPTAERERVFERFHRLDATRGRDRGGSGLGLAIVRDVVAAHQGSVTIQDAGPGALVIVWLPRAAD